MAKYGKATPEALVESALWECSLFEEHDFRDIKISVKHNDPVIMVQAYRLLRQQCDYPLHLGVTEAGPAFQGTIKSAVAFGALLAEGIGDTIRVSLSAPPVEEVKVGLAILESLNLKQRGLEIVSCPSCGRAQVDVYTLAEQVTAGLEGLTVPLRVAVMGCVVNGPGEAREADLGVASGNGKGQIFVKGEVIKTVPESPDRRDPHRGGPADRRGVRRPERCAGGRDQLRPGGARRSRLGRCETGGAEDDLGHPRAGRARPGRGAGPAATADPVADVFVASRIEAAGLAPSRLGAELWGYGDRGRLEAVCYSGANLVPVQAGPEAVRAFADRARRQGRRCSSIVGASDAVQPLWRVAGAQLGPGPRGPGAPAAHGAVRTARRRRRPRCPPGPAGRARRPAAGLHRHVHRGDRHLPDPG